MAVMAETDTTSADATDKLSPEIIKAARTRALDLIEFIDRGVTPNHATQEVCRRLSEAGFTELAERDVWRLDKGSRHYVTRNGTSVMAFVVGPRSPAVAGYSMVGAHTDSPSLKLKPKASYTKHGYRQVGVEVYGGPLLTTWLDRDLSVAGRLAVKDGAGTKTVLVDMERPLLRIPNVAIHLNRDVNKDGFKLNKQEHLPPLWGIAVDEIGEDALLARIAERAGVNLADVVDHDLSLYETSGGTLAGLDDAFVLAARLDNLASCHSGMTALLQTAGDAADATRVIALYDHEEVGSRSAQGAAGSFLRATLERIVDAHPDAEPQAYPRAIAASFLLSADMAHSVHPNYPDKHDARHMPLMGKGPVIKTNASQAYATDGESAAKFVALCKEAGFVPQNFVSRADIGCGSTIGPITAAQLGVKTVDVGNPMLSMHSIREMAGTTDVELMHRAMVALFSSAI